MVNCVPLEGIAPPHGLNSGERGATLADYAREDFYRLTPLATVVQRRIRTPYRLLMSA
nr:MAG TPA: hypothetical protein [Caudoviricetes sp.]